MTIYYLKQDDTIPGCGDPECCGEYYEEISESFVSCTHEVEVDADHLHGCNGGGPVLEWRKATPLEVQAYNDGHGEGWSDGADWGEKYQIERIIKLVERFGFDEELGFSFEQAKEDLLTLIKGEQTESKSVARRVKIQKGESAKGSVEPAQLEVLIKGEK